jgi:hypothetical protein
MTTQACNPTVAILQPILKTTPRWLPPRRRCARESLQRHCNCTPCNCRDAATEPARPARDRHEGSPRAMTLRQSQLFKKNEGRRTSATGPTPWRRCKTALRPKPGPVGCGIVKLDWTFAERTKEILPLRVKLETKGSSITRKRRVET